MSIVHVFVIAVIALLAIALLDRAFFGVWMWPWKRVPPPNAKRNRWYG